MPNHFSLFHRIALLLLAMMFFLQALSAQEQVTVGFQLNPILPAELIYNRSTTITNDDLSVEVTPMIGYSLGMVIRQHFDEKWAAQTGILASKRPYSFSATRGEFALDSSYRIISYEIPFTAILFTQLGRATYLSISGGFSADFFPSDILLETENFRLYAARKYFVLPSMLANFGFEARTKKVGYFYLGILYHRMITSMSRTFFRYEENIQFSEVNAEFSGHYFGFDFKYYFPIKDGL